MLKGPPCGRKEDGAAGGGDGQVTFGQNTIMKHGARRYATLPRQGISGLCRSVADDISLRTFRAKLGNMLATRSGMVQLAKEWRR